MWSKNIWPHVLSQLTRSLSSQHGGGQEYDPLTQMSSLRKTSLPVIHHQLVHHFLCHFQALLTILNLFLAVQMRVMMVLKTQGWRVACWSIHRGWMWLVGAHQGQIRCQVQKSLTTFPFWLNQHCHCLSQMKEVIFFIKWEEESPQSAWSPRTCPSLYAAAFYMSTTCWCFSPPDPVGITITVMFHLCDFLCHTISILIRKSIRKTLPW